jgi:hypothetical protein
MQITEPMTMITDYALAAITGLLGASLLRIGRAKKQLSAGLWSGAFIAIALTALIGGTNHGGGRLLTERVMDGLWKTTLFFSGFISFFMLMAAVVACLPARSHFWILGIAVVKLLLYLAWASTHDDFRYAIYDYGSATVAVLGLYLAAFFQFHSRAALWIIAGLLLSMVAAFLQRSGLDPSPQFNHNDLYHVIQMLAVYLLYKGALTPPAGER